MKLFSTCDYCGRQVLGSNNGWFGIHLHNVLIPIGGALAGAAIYIGWIL